MKTIQTTGAPSQGEGHYSQAIAHNGLVYVSGQLPLDPETRDLVGEDIETQTRRVMENIRSILEASGSGLDKLLKVNVFITDLSHWGKFNSVYAEILGDHKPSRAVIPCSALHFGALLEIDVISAI